MLIGLDCALQPHGLRALLRPLHAIYELTLPGKIVLVRSTRSETSVKLLGQPNSPHALSGGLSEGSATVEGLTIRVALHRREERRGSGSQAPSRTVR
jgi:hypothetical protein